MRDESELIRKAQTGVQGSFAELVAPYSPALLYELRKLIGDPAEAEDLLQDALIRAWRGLPNYADEGRFEGWLRTIARNVGLSALRRRAARRVIETTPVADNIPSIGADPEVLAAATEQLTRVEEMFRELPSEQQEVFFLRMLAGLTFQQIADRQGVPLNTALGRMHLVRRRLRAIFRGLFRWPVVVALSTAIVLLAIPRARLGGSLGLASSSESAPDADRYASYDFPGLGVLAYWPLDSDWTDVAGNRTGQSTGGEFVEGRFGGGWRVAPMEYFELAGYPELSLRQGGTVAAWYRPDDFGHDSGTVVGRGRDRSATYWLAIHQSFDSPRYAVVTCRFAASAENQITAFSDENPNWVGTWHHVACTYSPETGVRVFVDGLLAAENSGWPGPMTIEPDEPVTVNKNRWLWPASRDFQEDWDSRLSGILDEVVLFDRALSADEITGLASDADGDGQADFWEGAAPAGAEGASRFPE